MGLMQIVSFVDVIEEIIIYLGPILEPTGDGHRLRRCYSPGLTEMQEILGYQIQQRQQTLLNMALSCRAFTRPAIRALWWEMYSIEPLLRLIPNLQTTAEGQFALQGSLSKADFASFEEYGKYIYFLHRERDDISSALFTQIALIRQCTTFLPNLRYLEHPTTPELAFFLNPNLRYLSTSGVEEQHSDYPNWAVFISLFASNIQDLELETVQDEDETDIWTPISRMTSLRRLMLFRGPLVINQNIGIICSSLPNLSELLVRHIKLPPDDQTPILHSGKFINLRSLAITSTSLKQVTSLLEIIAFPMLANLELEFDKQNTDSSNDNVEIMWQVLLAKLSMRTPKLETLILSFSLDIIPLRPRQKNGGILFSNLQLPNLTQLTLQVPFVYSISDNDIDIIIRTWPKLQLLRLATCALVSIKVGAVSKLAQHLPHLESLDIGIDFKKPFPREELPVLNHPLKKLYLDHCEVGDRVRFDFCTCVNQLFPNVTFKSVEGPGRDIFNEFTRYLSGLKTAREHERACL